MWSLLSLELKKTRGCREDSNVAICLVIPASSVGLLESWNLACSPGCEASGNHSASKPICKQQLPQGDERISRRPGMTNDSHADSGFLFIVVMAVFPVTAGSRLFYPNISVSQELTQTGLQCKQVAGGRQIL